MSQCLGMAVAEGIFKLVGGSMNLLKTAIFLATCFSTVNAFSHDYQHRPRKSMLYCRDLFTLVDVSSGAERRTFPKECEEALAEGVRLGRKILYCKDLYNLADLKSSAVMRTFPRPCDEALEEISSTGYYCADLFNIVNGITGEKQRTFPKRCDEILN